MKTKYKIVLKMEGGTIIGTKEFMRPAGVIYYVTQLIPDNVTEVSVEDLETGAIATHEVKNHTLAKNDMDGLKAFLGGV